MRVLTVVGTRPEAIKMAPVITALRADGRFACRVCATGQHREMLHTALADFELNADIDLAVMTDGQSLNGLASTILARMESVLEAERPDCVLVHGDTTTAMAAAVSAFHRGLRVGHVEAGLRTRDLGRPWPEEMNRRVIDTIARDLFAPTPRARQALEAEALSGTIVVTGNTVVDGLMLAVQRLDQAPEPLHNASFESGRPLVLVTCHRRENHDGALEQISAAIAQIAFAGAEIVLPVHRNPKVRAPFEAHLSNVPHVHLVEPLGYLDFIRLLRRASVVLTDSGGVQEEAASLGRPLLVMRDLTERPEGLLPSAQLVGCSTARIVSAVSAALASTRPNYRPELSASPYGDGRAAARIVAALAGDSVAEFAPALPEPVLGLTASRTTAAA